MYGPYMYCTTQPLSPLLWIMTIFTVRLGTERCLSALRFIRLIQSTMRSIVHVHTTGHYLVKIYRLRHTVCIYTHIWTTDRDDTS